MFKFVKVWYFFIWDKNIVQSYPNWVFLPLIYLSFPCGIQIRMPTKWSISPNLWFYNVVYWIMENIWVNFVFILFNYLHWTIFSMANETSFWRCLFLRTLLADKLSQFGIDKSPQGDTAANQPPISYCRFLSLPNYYWVVGWFAITLYKSNRMSLCSDGYR